MKIDDSSIGIDTMGYQDEPAQRDRPPTTEEKVDRFDLSDCLRAVYTLSGGPNMGCCDDIKRDDSLPEQVNYSLHLCWDAGEEDYQAVVLEALERIVKEARRRGVLR